MVNLSIEKLVQNGASANEAINLMSLSYTSRLITERALARGWEVAHFPAALSILFFQIPGHKGLITSFSSSPSTTSWPASKVAKNKALTSRLLASADLPVPSELLLSEKNLPDSAKIIASFLAKHSPVVVKPLDASHGHGVTTHITEFKDVMTAIDRALEHSRLKRVLIQQQYDGNDVRIVCINYKFVDSITRVPARIFGNGKDSIEELIQKENDSGHRGENYKTKLNMIDAQKARQYLGAEGIKRVPAANKEVQVVGISNVGAGGERVNIGSQIPDWMKEMAEKAAGTLKLPVCGVDFLIKNLPSPHSKPKELQPIILEVNECPMLTMYDDLHSPEQFKVIDTYLNYLESLPVN
jgi:cyanophycin synthetase